AEAELQVALMMAQQGTLEPSGETREAALYALNAAVKSVAITSKQAAATAKESPEELGEALKSVANATANLVQSAKVLVGTVEDPLLQKEILKCIQGLTGAIHGLMQSSQAVACNPEDENLNKLL